MLEESAASGGVLPRLLAEEAIASWWRQHRRGPTTKGGCGGVLTTRVPRQKRAPVEEGST